MTCQWNLCDEEGEEVDGGHVLCQSHYERIIEQGIPLDLIVFQKGGWIPRFPVEGTFEDRVAQVVALTGRSPEEVRADVSHLLN